MKRLLVVCLLFISVMGVAKTVHAPLPPELMSAKTVYIANESGDAKLADRCYSELREWGRFTIVTDPKQADLVFRIGTSTRTTGYSADTTPDYGGSSSTDIRANHSSRTQIDVINRATGAVLWSDSKAWGDLYTGFRSATKGVIKELRKRMEEQEHTTEK